MRWLQHISFSSPSSSSSLKPSSSFSETPDRDHGRDRDRHRRGLGILGPRLTRQKKLRHLSSFDVLGDQPSSSSPAARFSRSPSDCVAIPRSQSQPEAMPLPLPLPLPESGDGARRHTGKNVVHGKGAEERCGDGDRDRADGGADKGSSSSSLGRDRRKTAENLEARSHTARQDRGKANSPKDSYFINIPTRSAPTSPFASPVLSPHRKSAGDIFPYFNMAPRENQVWSAPEMPLDISGLPPPAFFDYPAFSTDNSPFHSPQPRSPRQQVRSPSRPSSPLHPLLHPDPSSDPRDGDSSPLHPRLSVDVSGVRRENTNVHPLPLPPGAVLPSPSTSNPQVAPKLESFPKNSQWQKGKLIGRGTFGSVYVASNRETGALCAMKEVEMLPDDPKSAECIKQLEQEIKLLSHLQHPNIVQYYGSEIADDRFYIYLEYVHPGSINKYVREHFGAITESVVRNFTRHILSGLAYLHSKKTVHRDIKGANLLVDASGVVKLADFGMAKHLSGQKADLSLKGSPYWMAPELMQAVMQKDNSSDLAFAVDIWSLGCTIIEMFTGKPPWSNFEGAAAMFKVMRDTPSIPESLSPEGKDFLRCCFKRNPAERPTAAVLLEHRFLKNSLQLNSSHPDVQSCSQLVNGMKLTGKTYSKRERSPEIKHDKLNVLSGLRSTNKVTTSESETEKQRVHREPPADITMAISRHSPRSTLEAIPSPSPPRSGPFSTRTRANICAEKNNVYR